MSQLGIRIDDSGNWKVLKSGNIQLANYLLAKIRMQLKVLLGSWLYDTSIGSNVPLLIDQRQTLTKEQYKVVFQDAIAPLEKSGEIKNALITMTYFGLGYIEVTIDCTDSTGSEIRFNYTSRD